MIHKDQQVVSSLSLVSALLSLSLQMPFQGWMDFYATIISVSGHLPVLFSDPSPLFAYFLERLEVCPAGNR